MWWALGCCGLLLGDVSDFGSGLLGGGWCEGVIAECYEDVEAAALSLAGQTANLWFTLQEQQALRRLLGRQIQTSETILELLELRFQVSQATVLDVYQQRQQLAGTQAQVPVVDATMRTTWHRIQVLQGITPGGVPVGLATTSTDRSKPPTRINSSKANLARCCAVSLQPSPT